MKLTNYAISEYMGVLSSCTELKLPSKLSYAVCKTFQNIKKDYDFFIEQRNKIFSSYALVDDKGKVIAENNQIVPKEGCAEILSKELQDLLNIETDVNIYYINDESEVYYDDDSGHYSVLTVGQKLNLVNILYKSESEEAPEPEEGKVNDKTTV